MDRSLLERMIGATVLADPAGDAGASFTGWSLSLKAGRPIVLTSIFLAQLGSRPRFVLPQYG